MRSEPRRNSTLVVESSRGHQAGEIFEIATVSELIQRLLARATRYRQFARSFPREKTRLGLRVLERSRQGDPCGSVFAIRCHFAGGTSEQRNGSRISDGLSRLRLNRATALASSTISCCFSKSEEVTL